jgi:hypothetical protein
MITHEIDAYKRPALPVIPSLLPYMRSQKMYGKLEYANYIKGVVARLSKGDYVFKRGSKWPLTEDDYRRVQDIQELHGFVNYDDNGRPMCVFTRSRFGNGEWVCPDDLITVVNSPVVIPVQ